MTGIQDFKEATEILQNVDISEMFTSLALAVAKTQSKLDENSMNQLVKYAEYKVGGKSLLELGFVPAFYSLSEANISTYLSLKMAAKESIDVKVGLAFNYSNGNNLDKSQTDALNSNKDSAGVDDYKSGKTIAFVAEEKNKITVEGKDIEFNPIEGGIFKNCIAMVDGYENLLNGVSAVSEVKTTIAINEQQIKSSPELTIGDTGHGYLCISYPEKFTDKTVVFKHSDKSGDTMNGLFTVSPEKFETTLASIAASDKIDGLYAFSRDGKFYQFNGNGKDQTVSTDKTAVDMSIYFKTDPKEKKGDRIYWDQSIGDKKNASTLIDCYKKLVILLNSTEEPLTVAGYTTKSDDTYTKNLGDRRAQALKRLLKGLNIKKIDAKSDIDDKDSIAKITLNADYIVFDKKDVATLPTPTGANRFLLTNKDPIVGGAHIEGTTIPPMGKLINVKNFIEDNATLTDKYLFEIAGDERLLYILKKKVTLNFQLLSKGSNGLKIEAEKNPEKENSIFIKEDFSPATKLQTESPDAKGSKETFAIAATVDVRYAKQFDMSMEGNASMSAKLKYIAPPEVFTEFIRSKFN